MTKPNAPTGNVVSGKLTTIDTGIGIPNLLIVLYDVDPLAKPEEIIKSVNNDGTKDTALAQAKNTLAPLGDRIGSVLTAHDGSFQITYGNSEFQVSNPGEKRPDLFLLVLGPEQIGQSFRDRLVFFSPEIRQNAGKVENYLIQLDSKTITEKHINIPVVDDSAATDNKILSYQGRADNDKRYNDAILSHQSGVVKAKKDKFLETKKGFRKVLAPRPAIVDATYTTLVKEDETVADKLDQHIGGQMARRNTAIQNFCATHKGIEVTFLLNDADRHALGIVVPADDADPGTDKTFTDIYNSEPLKSVLDKMNSAGGDNLILTSDNPILKKTLTKNDDTKCAARKLGLDATTDKTDNKEVIIYTALPDAARVYTAGNHGGPDSVVIIYKYTSATDVVRYEVKLLDKTVLHFDTNGENTDIDDKTPLTSDEISHYVKKVISDIRSLKNSPADSNTTAKPDQNAVNDNVNNFSLKRGPAELPSFFDFHVLNIAFGHIWQQVIDDTPAQLATEIQTMAENRGFAFDATYKSQAKLMADFKMVGRILSNPPQTVISNFDITNEEWKALEPDAQEKLRTICEAIDHANQGLIFHDKEVVSAPFGIGTAGTIPAGYRLASPIKAQLYIQQMKEQGELILDYMRNNNSTAFHKILSSLDSALKSNFAFNIFGADDTAKAVNFGLLNTYRQKWEPVAYQVGNLVKSIPLAPKEERKYTLKTTFTRKRSEKEAKKNNSSLTQEQDTTSRAEEEIVAKASSKTNFNLGAEGGLGSWKITSSLGVEAAKDSSQNRKDFRESVMKSTQDYKQERSTEIDTEESDTSENDNSGTIVNPNDELAVTYLFYELQKRFKISEQLYRVMPVVLIAQDVPAPNEITETWVIANDWILNRSLLDDSFRPALQYIAQKNVGDDYSIRELRKNLRTQRQLVDTLKREFAMLNQQADSRYTALQRTIEDRIKQEEQDESDSWWDDIGESLFGQDKPTPESAKAREMAARDAQAYAADKAQQTGLTLQREINSLQSITADYNKAMREHLDKKTMVERLLLHIKNNIIYYMQAIWSMEPPDQRYMRLMNTKVPQFEIDQMNCEIMQKPQDDLFALFRQPNEKLHKAWLQPTIRQAADKTLVEVADLDTILGYKGNYMAFPMKQHNALTSVMAMPYIDASFGAMDPDQLSNISLEDYSRYVCMLREEMTEEEFDTLKKTLKDWLSLLLQDPLRNGDEVIVPTNSLYIEMLVSANSLLEEFKLQHREWDVYKVQEEVQMAALENLRLAQRILDKQLDDPKVDKKIMVLGSASTTVDTN